MKWFALFCRRRADDDPTTESPDERAQREREKSELGQRIHDAAARLHVLEFKTDVAKRTQTKGPTRD